MKFCAASLKSGNLFDGGTACESNFFALADGKHRTWLAGCFRRIFATTRQKMVPHLDEHIVQCQHILSKHLRHLTEQETALANLQTWQAQLAADNQTNPDPPPYVETRMDAGFASGENLTWLLEMGYYPNTKAANGQTTTALRAQLAEDTSWVRVGDNTEMTAWADYHLHGCPYPLTVALERFKVGREYKYATLVHYRDDGVLPWPPGFDSTTNARPSKPAIRK